MWCVHGAHDKLFSPTMKWTGQMLYKQQLTADQRIPHVRADIQVKGIYHCKLMFDNKDCVSLS